MDFCTVDTPGFGRLSVDGGRYVLLITPSVVRFFVIEWDLSMAGTLRQTQLRMANHVHVTNSKI